MKPEIPSALLARLQVMFTSGMTLQEVSEALQLEVPKDDVSRPEPVRSTSTVSTPAPSSHKSASPTLPRPPKPSELNHVDQLTDSEIPNGGAARPVSLPDEVVDYLYALVAAVQKLGEGVYAISGEEKIRRSKSLSLAAQGLIASTQSVAKIVNTINRYAPSNRTGNKEREVNVNRWGDAPTPPVPRPGSESGVARKFVEKPIPATTAQVSESESVLPAKLPPAKSDVSVQGSPKPQPPAPRLPVAPPAKPGPQVAKSPPHVTIPPIAKDVSGAAIPRINSAPGTGKADSGKPTIPAPIGKSVGATSVSVAANAPSFPTVSPAPPAFNRESRDPDNRHEPENDEGDVYSRISSALSQIKKIAIEHENDENYLGRLRDPE